MRMVMPGFVNYFYKDGLLPSHTRSTFEKHKILTIHGLMVKNALILMHKIKHFPNTVPISIRNLFPSSMPAFGSTAESCAEWLDYYGGRQFSSSIFFKGPLLAVTGTNTNITCLPSIFSLSIYKSSAKRVLLELQSSANSDEDWPSFLLHNIPGLRRSPRQTNV